MLAPKPSNTDAHWSGIYDSGRDFTLISDGMLTKLLSFTGGELPKTCLDIGCGTGQLTRELYHRGYKCVGIDASASAVKLASSLTVAPRERLRYLHFDIEYGDAAMLPAQPYSLITCKLVYAFIEDKPAFLRKVNKLLTPGGLFVVITPHVDDVPADRCGIAVNDSELGLLSRNFIEAAQYRGNELGGALTYFAGRA